MRAYPRKEIVLKGILVFAILFLFLDSLGLAIKHIGSACEISRHLKPDVRRTISMPQEKTQPKKDYSKYAEITSTLLKGGESFRLQAIWGDQAVVLYNNKPITVRVGDRVGSATVMSIEGLTVTLKKDDGTEKKLSL